MGPPMCTYDFLTLSPTSPSSQLVFHPFVSALNPWGSVCERARSSEMYTTEVRKRAGGGVAAVASLNMYAYVARHGGKGGSGGGGGGGGGDGSGGPRAQGPHKPTVSPRIPHIATLHRDMAPPDPRGGARPVPPDRAAGGRLVCLPRTQPPPAHLDQLHEEPPLAVLLPRHGRRRIRPRRSRSLSPG